MLSFQWYFPQCRQGEAGAAQLIHPGCFIPLFSIYSLLYILGVPHMWMSQEQIFLPPPQIRRENDKYKISEDRVPSYALVFSNGKTTKNDVAYFCNKHICINYILLTNGHAIRILGGNVMFPPWSYLTYFVFHPSLCSNCGITIRISDSSTSRKQRVWWQNLSCYISWFNASLGFLVWTRFFLCYKYFSFFIYSWFSLTVNNPMEAAVGKML